jgi:hypothetical protein
VGHRFAARAAHRHLRRQSPGWQALLITHGTSILGGQPLLVMDLSGQLASSELTSAAKAAAVPAAQFVLPADLDRCGLLSCLSPSQFADALNEAIQAGTPGGARADRAVDVRVLEQLTAALDGWITPARLAAAAQSALGHPIPPALLTAQEEMLTGGDLFPAAYRQQIGPNLARLDAFLADLAARPIAPVPHVSAAQLPQAKPTCWSASAVRPSALRDGSPSTDPPVPGAAPAGGRSGRRPAGPGTWGGTGPRGGTPAGPGASAAGRQRGQDLAGLGLADAVHHRVVDVPLKPDARETPRSSRQRVVQEQVGEHGRHHAQKPA